MRCLCTHTCYGNSCIHEFTQMLGWSAANGNPTIGYTESNTDEHWVISIRSSIHEVTVKPHSLWSTLLSLSRTCSTPAQFKTIPSNRTNGVKCVNRIAALWRPFLWETSIHDKQLRLLSRSNWSIVERFREYDWRSWTSFPLPIETYRLLFAVESIEICFYTEKKNEISANVPSSCIWYALRRTHSGNQEKKNHSKGKL